MDNSIYIKSRRFIPEMLYKCEHCQSVYEKEVVTCSNCGGKDFELIQGTTKYRNVFINKKVLHSIMKSSEAKRIDKNINYSKEVIHNFYEAFLAIFFFFFFMGLPFVVLHIIEEYKPKVHSYFFNSDFYYAAVLFIGILIDCLIGFGIYKLSKKEKAHKNVFNPNTHGINKFEEYILIVGLKYDIVKLPGFFKRYVVRVKYYSSNGVCFTLNSNNSYSDFPDNTVDLLINPNNIEEYYIGFGLEEKLRPY